MKDPGISFNFRYTESFLGPEDAPVTLRGNTEGSVIVSGESNTMHEEAEVSIMLNWREAEKLLEMLRTAIGLRGQR